MSLKRKLQALGFPNIEINISDEEQLSTLVIWLEQEKLHHLANKNHPLLKKGTKDWSKHFDKYVKDLGAPNLIGTSHEAQIHWLLGIAIQQEYSLQSDDYNKFASKNLNTSSVPSVVTENPLDKLDFSSKEFQKGVEKLAKTLKITPHPDPKVTLEACTTLVQQKLNPETIKNPQNFIKEGKLFPYKEADLGFDLKNENVNEVAKILRMLYINDLKVLQTKINECIVDVQNITANPKTDTKLGKVGI